MNLQHKREKKICKSVRKVKCQAALKKIQQKDVSRNFILQKLKCFLHGEMLLRKSKNKMNISRDDYSNALCSQGICLL